MRVNHRSDGRSKIMVAVRRPVYERFRDKCRAEGLYLTRAAAALLEAWADGEVQVASGLLRARAAVRPGQGGRGWRVRLDQENQA